MAEKLPGFGVFGCSLDTLDAYEKVEMKLAYMDAVTKGIVPEGIAQDPYDLLSGDLTAAARAEALGKLMLESWVTPRPDPADTGMVSALEYREFLGSGGCAAVCERLAGFVRDSVLPLRPLLVGVDHSLSGGVCEVLADLYGPDGLALIVLDSHFDALSSTIRRNACLGEAGGPGGAEGVATPYTAICDLPDSYTCGNWIADLIERGVLRPENVAVIGPSDHPGYEGDPDEDVGLRVYRRAYLSLEEKGVRVVPKRSMRHRGVAEAILPALEGLEGRAVYLSIDADVGAGEQVGAVRFLDTIGLSGGELESVFGVLAAWLAASGSTLAGMDLMEIDVHLADIPGSTDRTVASFAGPLKRFIEGF